MLNMPNRLWHNHACKLLILTKFCPTICKNTQCQIRSNWSIPRYIKTGETFGYTEPWSIESDFIVDEICVWNIANQCKKDIDNIDMIIQTRCNCIGWQMQPNFSPLLLNPSIVDGYRNSLEISRNRNKSPVNLDSYQMDSKAWLISGSQ